MCSGFDVAVTTQERSGSITAQFKSVLVRSILLLARLKTVTVKVHVGARPFEAFVD